MKIKLFTSFFFRTASVEETSGKSPISVEEELKDAVQEQTETKAEPPKSIPADKAEPSTSSAASPTSEEKAGGGWGLWGWVESAKSKSKEVLEAVKKDLDELSTVVKEEAHAASEVFGLNQPESTVGAMKKSFSTFLGQMSEVLVPPMEDEDAEPVMITKDGLVTLTGFAKHLAELQANDATYLNEPDEMLASQYQRWLEVIEQDQFTEPRLTKQLTSSQILNEKYLNLVPSKVAHMDFWKRYLFKKALLEDAVANAEAATKKAEGEVESTKTVVPDKIIVQTEQPKPTVTEEDELKMWEADLGTQNIELSEEEQARLLEEYEKEIKEREVKTTEAVEVPKKTGAIKKQTQQNSNQTSNKNQQGKQQNQQNNSKTAKTGPSGKGGKGKNNKPTTQPSQQKIEKVEKKEEQSSTSDESWEKDFDDVEQK